MIIVAATAFGTALGGPVGASLAVAIATPFALKIQADLGRKVEDKRIQEQTPEVTLDLIFGNMVVNIVGANAGALLGKYLKALSSSMIKEVGKGAAKELSVKAGFAVVGEISDDLLAKVSEM
jgi:hypothetical protein